MPKPFLLGDQGFECGVRETSAAAKRVVNISAIATMIYYNAKENSGFNSRIYETQRHGFYGCIKYKIADTYAAEKSGKNPR